MNYPISVIIPTKNRSHVLLRTLESICQQNVQPAEIIVIDASDNNDSYNLCKEFYNKIIWQKAIESGAAVQRNQGIKVSSQEFILFADDDITLENNCIERLWHCVQDNDKTAGANAIITNQKYTKPGKVTSLMFGFMYGSKLENYAGKCIGPAWNILPSDSDMLPDIIPVEWLNTTCTLYRKKALPNPPFPKFFFGYSLLEDVYLSLIVGKNWNIYTVKNAKIFHDSQPGFHKNNVFRISKMELINRHFVMVKALNRNSFKDYLKLFILEAFQIISQYKNYKAMHKIIGGKIAGIFEILFKKI